MPPPSHLEETIQGIEKVIQNSYVIIETNGRGFYNVKEFIIQSHTDYLEREMLRIDSMTYDSDIGYVMACEHQIESLQSQLKEAKKML